MLSAPSLGHRKADVTAALVENPLFSLSHIESSTDPHDQGHAKLEGIRHRDAGRSRCPIRKPPSCRLAIPSPFRNGHPERTSQFAPRCPVDRPVVATTVSDAVVAAAIELWEIQSLVGLRGYALLIAVINTGRALSEIATTRREKSTAADLLRLCLTDRWGYAIRKGRQESRRERESEAKGNHGRTANDADVHSLRLFWLA
jgi:hypothetical protein